MKYKCIIFDCDGVIVDSEEITNRVLSEMANEVGINIEMKYANENFIGKSLEAIFQDLEGKIKGNLPANFEIEFRNRTFELFKKDLKPIEGIHSLLEKIFIPVCVASGGPIEKIKLNLKKINLFERFENKIFSSYEIQSWKPSPKIFEFAAKEMGFKPYECAVIEDSLSGIVAALDGGFDVFGFANKHNYDAFEKKGAKIFFEMNHLYNLLEGK